MMPFATPSLAVASPGGPIVQTGVLAYKTTTQVDASAGVTYDAEAYDVTGWHSTSSTTDRFTVPSGVSYVRFGSQYYSGSIYAVECYQSLNGAAFHGMAQSRGDTTGGTGMSLTSAIIAVSPGDVFRAYVTGTSKEADVNSWSAIEVVSLPKTALVRKSSNQSVAAGTLTTMTWDTEVRDTDSFHDNSTNNTRLTVPATGLYRVSANMKCGTSPASGQMVLSMTKNGASVVGLPQCDNDVAGSASADGVNGVSAILSLTAGDYLETICFFTNALSVAAHEATWFQIEQVAAGTKYALVRKSATQSISGGVSTLVAFGAEVADTHSFHDNTTNNTRLTIPSGQGITQARLSFNMTSANAIGQFVGTVLKNGAVVPGLSRSETDTAGSDSVNGFGAWIDVTAGDYFELQVYATNSQTLPNVDTTWFCIECR